MYEGGGGKVGRSRMIYRVLDYKSFVSRSPWMYGGGCCKVRKSEIIWAILI